MVYAPDELNQGAYALPLIIPQIKFEISAPDKKKIFCPRPLLCVKPPGRIFKGRGQNILTAFERNSAPDENISALSKIGICP